MLHKCTIVKIMGVFFDEPTKEHYLKEISQKTGIAHTSIKNNLEMLKKENIIKEKKYQKGKRSFPVFIANIENFNYINNKKIDNLIRIFDSGLIDFLRDELMPSTMVLFGSFLRGEDTEESDIDIYISSKSKEIKLKKFENKLKRKLQLHFKKNFSDFSFELKNNIINGFVLYGFLEAIK